jgi:nitroreductase
MDASDLKRLMETRRSVRRFRPEPLDPEVVKELVAAAVTAPSASNKQPWRFVVVTERATIARMAAAVREAVERIARHVEPGAEVSFRAYGDYFTRFEEAPCVIGLLARGIPLLTSLVDERLAAADGRAIADMEESSGLIGAAMALQNLLLMAHALGLGASGMTGPLVAAEALRGILGVPPSWRLAALVPVGHPAE